MSELADRGLVSPELQIATEPNVVKYANLTYDILLNANYRNSLIVTDVDKFVSFADDSAQLVNKLDELMCAGAMTDDTKQIIVQAIDEMMMGGETAQRRIRAAIYLLMNSADYQVAI